MAAAVASLSPPPCHGCAGGKQVNGVPCRDCRGTGRQAAKARLRASWRRVLHGWSLAVATPAGTLVGTVVRWSTAVPGVAGAVGVTIGVAMIVHGVFRQVPEPGLVALAGGVFGLLADRRL